MARKASDIVAGVLHHSGGPITQSAASIKNYHVNIKGYLDVAYDWLIENDGKVVKGRSLALNGAHAPGHNHNSISICIIGNNLEPVNAINDQQRESLWYLLKMLEKVYPGIEWKTHKEVMPAGYTDCPGFDNLVIPDPFDGPDNIII